MRDRQAQYSISASQRVFVDHCMLENEHCSADSARDVAVEEKIRQALAYLTDEVRAGNKPNVAHASRSFGCPLTTLRCRWKGRRFLKEANEPHINPYYMQLPKFTLIHCNLL